MGRRLAHASSLTYRFWGDASREEFFFGVTPRARNCFFGVTPRARRHPKKNSSREASPQKKIPRVRRHPNACEESPRKWTYGP